MYHLQLASEIWKRLEEKYGYISDIKRTNPENQFHQLCKKDAVSMKAHIAKFSALQQEVDSHSPE
jgi:hypothetical protein